MKTTQLIVVVAVLLSLPWALAQDPGITTQPTNTSVSLGATAQFKCLVSATHGPVIYRWSFKEAALDPKLNPSAAVNVLSLTNVTLANAGPYFMVVTDALGLSATSQVAVLDVDPTFTKIMTGPIVSEGSWAETCSWGDFDGDGRIDLFIARSGGQGGANLMYQNQGQGLFIKVNNAVTRAGAGLSVGNAWADYDNNGALDLVVGEFNGRPDMLFRNDGGGKFTQVPKASFPNDMNSTHYVAWADYDLDGNVDLFMTSWEVRCTLYHNNGDGTFSPITEGVLMEDGTAAGCTWSDYDRDSYPDLLLVAGQNRLYHNNGDGSFSRVTSGSLVTESGWAAAWGDYDNDGWPDVFVARIDGANLLYHNEGDGTFAPVANTVTSARATSSRSGTWGDYDNDGYLDLFVSNATSTDNRGENNFLFHNDRQGGFTRIETGSLVNDGGNGSGCAWGDLDNDGFLDLAAANWDVASRTFLYPEQRQH